MFSRHMCKVQLKVLDPRIGKEVPMPQYGTAGSAGMDMMAAIAEPLTIMPGEAVLIDTGLSIFVQDPNYAAILLPRSGLGHKQGLVLGNLVGLIDSAYQGPLKVSLWNRSNEPREIKPFDRIAQLVLIPVMGVQFQVVDDFIATDRGAGGFGSTGVVTQQTPQQELAEIEGVLKEELLGRGQQPYITPIDDSGFVPAAGLAMEIAKNMTDLPIPAIYDETSALPSWNVWLEGFAATGNISRARFLGVHQAATFKEACAIAIRAFDDYNESCYSPERNTYWGCHFFDNEADARKSFG